MNFNQIPEVHGQLPESIAPAPEFSRSVTTKGKVQTWVTHSAERTGEGTSVVCWLWAAATREAVGGAIAGPRRGRETGPAMEISAQTMN
jgi:hypothetical protein